MGSNRVTDEQVSRTASEEEKAAIVSSISMQERLYQFWQSLGMAFVPSGAYPLIKSDLGFGFLGGGSVGPIPWPVIIAILVFVAGYIILKRTVFGRRIYAIGGNEQAARLSGINVDRMLIWVYTI